VGRIKKIFFPFFLFLLFNAYQVNILLFSHVHYLNGIPVAHSHPNKGEHHHQEDGIRFIALLSHIHSINNDFVFSFTDGCFFVTTSKLDNRIPLIQEIHLKEPSLRAPPCIG